MQQDPSLHDEQLESEIRLVSDLVLAASQSDDRLSQELIDEILGIGERGGAPGAPESPSGPASAGAAPAQG